MLFQASKLKIQRISFSVLGFTQTSFLGNVWSKEFKVQINFDENSSRVMLYHVRKLMQIKGSIKKQNNT